MPKGLCHLTIDHKESIFTYHSGILNGIHLTCPQRFICGDFSYNNPFMCPFAECARSPGECIVKQNSEEVKLCRRETVIGHTI